VMKLCCMHRPLYKDGKIKEFLLPPLLLYAQDGLDFH